MQATNGGRYIAEATSVPADSIMLLVIVMNLDASHNAEHILEGCWC